MSANPYQTPAANVSDYSADRPRFRRWPFAIMFLPGIPWLWVCSAYIVAHIPVVKGVKALLIDDWLWQVSMLGLPLMLPLMFASWFAWRGSARATIPIHGCLVLFPVLGLLESSLEWLDRGFMSGISLFFVVALLRYSYLVWKERKDADLRAARASGSFVRAHQP